MNQPVRPFRGLVEFSPAFAPRAQLTHVLFDFDGTLSLIREGWVEVMTPMFAEMLPALPGESEEARLLFCREDILRLNGRQTIYQMLQLVERIRERGGTPRSAQWYKEEYLGRLGQRICGRVHALRNRDAEAEKFLVHGARHMLEILCSRGLKLYLASGTDEPAVQEEADLLGLTAFFGPHIYGAREDYVNSSKKVVIDRLLAANRISGTNLLSFGDGYVEIQNTKDVGGLAVAVASDEARNGSGQFDEWKRQRLLGVGADVVVPDYRDAAALLDCIIAG